MAHEAAEIAKLAERVAHLEHALVRIAETDRHTRRVRYNPDGGLRGQAGMIAVFALTGQNGSYLTDAAVRAILSEKGEQA